MRFAYLGLFEKVFNWVWDKILSPIVNWLSDIISKVLSWVFREVLVPVLRVIIDAVLPEILDLVKEILSGILYYIFSYICKIIDYITIGFDIFIGTKDVTYTAPGAAAKTGPLLNIILGLPAITKAFWIITGVGLGIALILCIYAVIKSTLDFDMENKRPVGTVMKSMFKCFVTLMTTQLMVLFILYISSIIMSTFEVAVNAAQADKPQSMGCIVFAVSSLDASKTPSDNISYTNADKSKNYLTLNARGYFYVGHCGEKVFDYTDVDLVEEYFDLAKFDYLVGFIVSLFLLVIMVTCCIVFVKRVFEVVMLYLVSPFFVATMPIDDGEKFKKWKEMFIAKVFSGFGSLLAMKLYLLLCPIIVDNSITWGTDNTTLASAYLIKILFLVGGAYTMTKVGPMITTMLNFQAGQAEEAVSSYVGSRAFGMVSHGVSAAVMGAAGLAGSAFRTNKEKTAIADQKFAQIRGNQTEEENELMNGNGGGKGGSGGKGSGGDGAFKGTDKPGGGLDVSTSGNQEGPGISNQPSTGDKAAADSENGKFDGKKQPTIAPEDQVAAKYGTAKQNAFDRFLNKCHKILPHKTNPDGSYSFNFCGVKLRYDKNGNRTGVSMPFVQFKYDKNGQRFLSGVSAPGLFKMKRTQGPGGSLKFTDVPAIGLHMGVDPKGHRHVENVAGLKFGRAYNSQTGNFEVSGVRVGNYVFGADKYRNKPDK